MKPSDIIQASISRKIGHRHALNDIDYLKACCESIQEYLDEQYENAHDNSGNKPHGIFIGEVGLEKHLKSENQAFMHIGPERIKVNEPKWPDKLNIDANGSRDLVLMNIGYNDAIDRCIKAWENARGVVA